MRLPINEITVEMMRFHRTVGEFDVWMETARTITDSITDTITDADR